jgi:hypothetical protein
MPDQTRRTGRGGPRPHSGRPRQPVKNLARRSYSFSASPSEWEEIQARAKEAGLTTSEYIRRRTLADDRHQDR